MTPERARPMTTVERPARRTVAVWRSDWLRRSETFIANQIASYRRWHPFRMARRQIPGGLGAPDLSLYSTSIPSKLEWRALGTLRHRREYVRALEASRAELVHAHFGWDAVSVLPLVEAADLPLVVTFHGSDVAVRPTGSRGRRYERGLSRVFDRASFLVAISEFVAAGLLEMGAPADKLFVSHIGVPTAGRPAAARRRAGVLFAGRFVGVKGVADVLYAYARLPAQQRDASPLVLVGDGPERPALEALNARLGIGADFRGWCSPSMLAELMARSEVFCGPSRTMPDGSAEGFGIVFLEAALQGLPVVAYRHGGVSEAVAEGATGLLADEGDVAGLSDRLGRVLGDPELARTLGSQGRRRVLECFDIDRSARELEALYERVVR